MKKLVALLCTMIMVVSLASSVMAQGSVGKIVKDDVVIAQTDAIPAGGQLVVADVDVEKLSDAGKALAEGDTKAAQDYYVANGIEMKLYGTDVDVDLTEYEAIVQPFEITLEGTNEADFVDGKTVEINLGIELTGDKTAEDYLVTIERINPDTNELEVAFVVPREVDGKLVFDLPFPGTVAVLEK